MPVNSCPVEGGSVEASRSESRSRPWVLSPSECAGGNELYKLLTSGFVHPSEKGNIQVISAPWASGVLLGAVVCAGPFERFQASVVQL